MIFKKADFTEIWFKLESNEELGVLDTGYIEDYYGVNGQLTLENISTNTEYIILMNESVDSVHKTIFIGYLDLRSLPNGDYILKGRVRDVIGNYTVLSRFHLLNSGNIVPYSLTVTSSADYGSVTIGGLTLSGGFTMTGSISINTVTSTRFETSESTVTHIVSDINILTSVSSDMKTIVKLNGDTTLNARF